MWFGVLAKLTGKARGAGEIDSPRSGRKHKAWGASPRIINKKSQRARETGDSLKWSRCRPLRGLNRYWGIVILGLAPQALCFRPLRRLNAFLGFASKVGSTVGDS